MNKLLSINKIAVLALVFPVAALAANVTGTPTLNANQTLNLDTDTVGSSGGDILWNGATITFQGSATGLALSAFIGTGQSIFNTLSSESILSALSGDYSGAPISPGSLAVGDIFAVKTNLGNYAAVIVTANNSAEPVGFVPPSNSARAMALKPKGLQVFTSGSITLQFVTFQSGSTTPTGPTITEVLNNYGLIPGGFPNSGIAPGSLFIIKGSGLASATSVSSLESTTGGSVLPTTLNGASVKVTVGSVTVVPAFYYAENVQLALVLPSGTPVGAGTVTVTYNNQTSAPFSIQVVTSAFGINSYYSTGTGLAQAYSLSYGLYNYGNSVPPGTTIRLIGSGLGADPDPTRDTQYVTPSVSQAINALAHVYVGGTDASIFYQGPEGYPGLDEIDITVPANAPTGCFISVVGVTAAGVPTNFLSLPIGSGQCEDPGLGYSGSTLSSLSGLATVNVGFVEMIYSTSPSTNGGGGTQTFTDAGAEFLSYTGAQFGASSGLVSIGGCYVYENLGTSTTTTTTTVSTTALSAGTITVSSPNAGVAPVTLQSEGSLVPGFYGQQLPSGFLTQAGGAFPFTATAGTQVGAFNTTINFPTPLLNWTNQTADATVARSKGLTVTWSGGSPGTYVIISGSSSAAGVAGFFSCLAPVAAQTFTVPSYVLATLPASTTGSLEVGNETVPQAFTATGLNYGYAIGAVDYAIDAVYQ